MGCRVSWLVARTMKGTHDEVWQTARRPARGAPARRWSQTADDGPAPAKRSARSYWLPDVKMFCRDVRMVAGRAYGCGQCMPCRINKKRVWVHRIMLEADQHASNAFVTLTYDDEHLPEDGSLHAKDAQDWLKRYRRAIEPRRVRYFLVGEYGDATWRPHYHVAIFNGLACERGNTRYSKSGSPCCDACSLLASSWQRGAIHCGDLSAQSASYIAGYTTKKMTAKDDARLEGRAPEFARMSLRPGIGAHMMADVAHELLSLGLEAEMIDVPANLRHGGKVMPLGRYLRRRLRESMGREANAPAEAEIKPEVQAVYDAAAALKAPQMARDNYIRASLMELDDGRAQRVINRQNRQRRKQL